MRNMMIAVVAVLVLGIIGFQVSQSDAFQDAMNSEEAAPLINTRWKLVELNGNDFTMPNGMTQEPTLTLQPDNNRMAGFAGCNRFSGSYILVGKKISFPDSAMTRMACTVGMETEQEFAQMLRDITTWHIRGKTLMLRDRQSETRAVFEQILIQ